MIHFVQWSNKQTIIKTNVLDHSILLPISLRKTLHKDQPCVIKTSSEVIQSRVYQLLVDNYIFEQTGRQTDGWTNRLTDRQARQAGRQTDRQTRTCIPVVSTWSIRYVMKASQPTIIYLFFCSICLSSVSVCRWTRFWLSGCSCIEANGCWPTVPLIDWPNSAFRSTVLSSKSSSTVIQQTWLKWRIVHSCHSKIFPRTNTGSRLTV